MCCYFLGALGEVILILALLEPVSIFLTEVVIRKELPDTSTEVGYLLGDWKKRDKVPNLTAN